MIFKKNNLSNILVYGMAILLVAMMTIYVANSIKVFKQSHIEASEKSISQKSRLVGKSLVNGLLAVDIALLEDSLSVLAQNDEFIYAAVYAPHGKLLAYVGEIPGEEKIDSSFEEAKHDHVYDVKQPISYSGAHLGVLNIGFSIQDVEDLIDSSIWKNILIAILELAIVLGCLIVSGKYIKKRLEKLTKGAEELANGNYKYRFQEGNDELGNLAENFNQLSKKLEASDKELKKERIQLLEAANYADKAHDYKIQFLANMSHELRTPLNAVLGYTDIVKETIEFAEEVDDAKEAIGDLDKVERAGNHLLSIINDILVISKSESGDLELNETVFKLNDLVQNVVTDMQRKIRLNGNKAELHISDVVGNVFTDSSRIRTILRNLIDNAANYTKDGVISVSVNMLGDLLILDVEDNGIGISEDKVNKVFSPFYQIDNSCTRAVDGAGLGLSIVKTLCSLMGGRIIMNSKKGQGTKVTVSIPQGSIGGEEHLVAKNLAS